MKKEAPKMIIDIDLSTDSPIIGYAEYLWNHHLVKDYNLNPDPYFKLPRNHKDNKRDIRFNEDDGRLHVKNFSAWWIPHLSITREIGGTVYSVTGSYDGEEDFLRKLERISFKKHMETEVNLNDTDDSK